jgi:uncharacterized protein
MKNFQLNAIILSAGIALAGLSSTTAFASDDDGYQKMCEGDSCQVQMRKLKKHARYGNPEALVLLASAYLNGDGVEKDPVKAYKKLKRAAGERSGKAMFMLSAMKRDGIGTDKDMRKSNLWLEKAVAVKYPPAMYQKALQTLDFNKADNSAELALLLEAEEKDNKAATYLMSVLRETGTLVEKDEVKAAEGFRNLSFWGYKDSSARLQAIADRWAEAEVTDNEGAERIAQLADGIEMALDATITRITSGDMQIYDGRSTGSHIPGGCTRKRNCSIISDPNDISMMGLMNASGASAGQGVTGASTSSAGGGN